MLDIQIIESEPKETVESEKKEYFVDPAIVSYGRPERYLAPDAKVNGSFVTTSETTSTTIVTSGAEVPPQAVSPISAGPATTGAEDVQSLHADVIDPSANPSADIITPSADAMTPSATLTAPFNDLSLNGDAYEEGLGQVDGMILKHQDTDLLALKEAAQGRAPSSRKRARKSGARRGSLPAQTQNLPDLESHSTPVATQKRRGKGKGWRQTPLLEERPAESPSPQARQRGQHPKGDTLEPTAARFTKQTPGHPESRRRRYREEEDQNGWATGDATDIQDMGDFDFEENLSKFDKRKVFDQIRQEDTTADEARLVSFNRLPAARSGTAGGKNLHYTENVLDSPIYIPNLGQQYGKRVGDQRSEDQQWEKLTQDCLTAVKSTFEKRERACIWGSSCFSTHIRCGIRGQTIQASNA